MAPLSQPLTQIQTPKITIMNSPTLTKLDIFVITITIILSIYVLVQLYQICNRISTLGEEIKMLGHMEEIVDERSLPREPEMSRLPPMPRAPRLGPVRYLPPLPPLQPLPPLNTLSRLPHLSPIAPPPLVSRLSLLLQLSPLTASVAMYWMRVKRGFTSLQICVVIEVLLVCAMCGVLFWVWQMGVGRQENGY